MKPTIIPVLQGFCPAYNDKCFTAAQVQIMARVCEKVAGDLGLGSVFLVSATTYKWLIMIKMQYVRKNDHK